MPGKPRLILSRWSENRNGLQLNAEAVALLKLKPEKGHNEVEFLQKEVKEGSKTKIMYFIAKKEPSTDKKAPKGLKVNLVEKPAGSGRYFSNNSGRTASVVAKHLITNITENKYDFHTNLICGLSPDGSGHSSAYRLEVLG